MRSEHSFRSEVVRITKKISSIGGETLKYHRNSILVLCEFLIIVMQVCKGNSFKP